MAMMFSDVVNITSTLLSLPPNALIPLLILTIPAWFAGKLFHSWIQSTHPFFLGLAALFFYTVAASQVQDGKRFVALLCGVPLIFLGREGYRRLSR